MINRRLQSLHELLFIKMLEFWRKGILKQILLQLLQQDGRNTTTLYPAAVIADNVWVGRLGELFEGTDLK